MRLNPRPGIIVKVILLLGIAVPLLLLYKGQILFPSATRRLEFAKDALRERELDYSRDGVGLC